MKAVRLASGRRIAPFGDPVGEVPVLGRPLAAVQEAVLASLGIELVPAPPPGEAHLVFSDRTWFTAELVRRLLAAGPGRLRVDDPGFLEATAPLQGLDAPGVYEIALHPGDQRGLGDLEPVTVDLGLHDVEMPELHAALRHALRPARVGPAMVHQLDHWVHLVRVNQLALAAVLEEAALAWRGSPWWRRLGRGLALAWRARGLRPDRVARALCEIAPDARIHPSAVVEVSRIGPGVEIGPQAVVRASVLAEGCRVEDHGTVLMSSLGARTHVGRYAFANLCVSWPGAQISAGAGYQVSAFGRDSFVAWGAAGLDLSFGAPVRVDDPDRPGERADSGHHFVGVAVGHGARVGNAVRLNHGVAVPNGAFLVADGRDLLRRWDPAAPRDGTPLVVRDGRPVPLRRAGGPPEGG